MSIQQLEERIDNLDAEIESLMQRLDALEAERKQAHRDWQRARLTEQGDCAMIGGR